MKKQILYLLVSMMFVPFVTRAGGMYFIENKGQWDSDILFRTEIPGGFLFLKKQSLVYVFYDASKIRSHHKANHAEQERTISQPQAQNIPAHGVEVKMKNASATVRHQATRAVKTQYSYFVGNDPKTWASDIQAFEEVLYEGIYPGIDMRIYMHALNLKYEFIVHPQGNPADISMKYEGATSIALNQDGQILVKTPLSSFKEAKPYTFQEVQKKTTEVKSRFSMGEDHTIHFLLPEGYNKSEKLIIDPELIFSTYSGSVSDNWGHTATYDNEGNLYSGGTVFGATFPVTTGSFQVAFQGLVDVVIMKFSPDGSNLLYATFLGGRHRDVPTSMIVNSKKELVILGITSSTNFPVSGNAFQKVFGGGSMTSPISGMDMTNGSDIFLSKLSSDGKQLLGSTYIGGSGNDGLSTEDRVTIKNYGDSFRGEVVVDKEDNIVVASSTNSSNFPLKNPARDNLSGRQDGIVFRLSSNLSSLLWSTYVGGDQYDAAFSVKVTDSGETYLTGITQSNNLPVHATAYQSKLKGGEDAFVARYTGDRLTGMTYMGTDAADGGYLLDLDKTENVYVYGTTNGPYPVSAGVYSNPKSGQFIHALDAGLSKTILSTVIGSGRGTPDISPTAFLVSECGNIYLAGWGGSINREFPHNEASNTNGLVVTPDAIQRTTNGSNFYIAILEEGAKSLLYGTFFGSMDRSGQAQGDHVDGGTSRFDKNGVIYHATCACGGSYFPVTPQAWSKTNRNENCNSVAFKIDIDRLKANFDVYEGDKKDVTKGCAPLTLSFENTSEGGVTYIWDVNGNTISREENGGEYQFTEAGTYTVTLKAYNRLSCKRMDIAEKIIVVESLDAKVSGDTTVCENTKVQLLATGGTTYKWTPTDGLSDPTSSSPTASVKESTTYAVEISTSVGCKVTEEVKIEVEKKEDFVVSPDTEICAGATTTLVASGNAAEYRWHAVPGLPETIGNSVVVKPESTTTYTVEGLYKDGCKPIRQITVVIDRSHEPDFEIVTSGESCNEPFRYSLRNLNSKGTRYEWNLGEGATKKDVHIDNYLYEVPGEYLVTLTSYNAAGCPLSVTKKVEAEPPFILHNVITPNGDGKNDFFYIPLNQSVLEIYNRWGKRVYKSIDYKNDWGKGVESGTYYYVVDTPSGKHCKGWVQVIK